MINNKPNYVFSNFLLPFWSFFQVFTHIQIFLVFLLVKSKPIQVFKTSSICLEEKNEFQNRKLYNFKFIFIETQFKRFKLVTLFLYQTLFLILKIRNAQKLFSKFSPIKIKGRFRFRERLTPNEGRQLFAENVIRRKIANFQILRQLFVKILAAHRFRCQILIR